MRAAVGRGDVRVGRRRRPHRHRRRRLRRLLHPPDGPRHRPRGARGSLPRLRQRHPAGRRATPSRSSPASTCRAGAAPASKTSSWPPRPGPNASTRRPASWRWSAEPSDRPRPGRAAPRPGRNRVRLPVYGGNGTPERAACPARPNRRSFAGIRRKRNARCLARRRGVMKLQVSTVLLQWAIGGLFFLWVTTRRREVGIGYGWTVRLTYLVMALGAAGLGRWLEADGAAALLRDVGALGVAGASAYALWLSFARRRAGVAGERTLRRARAARVAAMTGDPGPDRYDDTVPEFPPAADLARPGHRRGGAGGGGSGRRRTVPPRLRPARVRRRLSRRRDRRHAARPLLPDPAGPVPGAAQATGSHQRLDLAGGDRCCCACPTGWSRCSSGSIDDGANGLLGWIWLLSTISTIVLLFVVEAALRERWYSAVMAATGLLYLAILTAFGQDLVARAVLGR